MMQTLESSLTMTLIKLKSQFQEHYQNRLNSLFLFGSQARQDASPDSDINVLVLLNNEVNPVTEIKENSDWLSSLCLETDTVIRCIYLSFEQFQSRDDPFIQEIKRDRIQI